MGQLFKIDEGKPILTVSIPLKGQEGIIDGLYIGQASLKKPVTDSKKIKNVLMSSVQNKLSYNAIDTAANMDASWIDFKFPQDVDTYNYLNNIQYIVAENLSGSDRSCDVSIKADSSFLPGYLRFEQTGETIKWKLMYSLMSSDSTITFLQNASTYEIDTNILCNAYNEDGSKLPDDILSDYIKKWNSTKYEYSSSGREYDNFTLTYHPNITFSGQNDVIVDSSVRFIDSINPNIKDWSSNLFPLVYQIKKESIVTSKAYDGYFEIGSDKIYYPYKWRPSERQDGTLSLTPLLIYYYKKDNETYTVEKLNNNVKNRYYILSYYIDMSNIKVSNMEIKSSNRVYVYLTMNPKILVYDQVSKGYIVNSDIIKDTPIVLYANGSLKYKTDDSLIHPSTSIDASLNFRPIITGPILTGFPNITLKESDLTLLNAYMYIDFDSISEKFSITECIVNFYISTKGNTKDFIWMGDPRAADNIDSLFKLNQRVSFSSGQELQGKRLNGTTSDGFVQLILYPSFLTEETPWKPDVYNINLGYYTTIYGSTIKSIYDGWLHDQSSVWYTRANDKQYYYLKTTGYEFIHIQVATGTNSQFTVLFNCEYKDGLRKYCAFTSTGTNIRFNGYKVETINGNNVIVSSHNNLYIISIENIKNYYGIEDVNIYGIYGYIDIQNGIWEGIERCTPVSITTVTLQENRG